MVCSGRKEPDSRILRTEGRHAAEEAGGGPRPPAAVQARWKLGFNEGEAAKRFEAGSLGDQNGTAAAVTG